MYPSNSLAKARVYSNTQYLPGALIYWYVGFSYGTFDISVTISPPENSGDVGAFLSSTLMYWINNCPAALGIGNTFNLLFTSSNENADFLTWSFNSIAWITERS